MDVHAAMNRMRSARSSKSNNKTSTQKKIQPGRPTKNTEKQTGAGLSFGGKSKKKKTPASARRLRQQPTQITMRRADIEKEEQASAFFADKLPGAWKEKLWDIVGNSSGVNIHKQAAKREVVEREYRNAKKKGALDSMQKATLSRELMHRPTRETLFNTGVLNRGGLLSIIEWNRLYTDVEGIEGDEEDIANKTSSKESGKESDKESGANIESTESNVNTENTNTNTPANDSTKPVAPISSAIDDWSGDEDEEDEEIEKVGELFSLQTYERHKKSEEETKKTETENAETRETQTTEAETTETKTKKAIKRKNNEETVRCPGRPGYVPLPHFCISIACGESHTLAIIEGGAVFLWGKNGSGQLGFPADTHNVIHEPHLLMQLKGVDCMSAACGKNHCVVVTEGGGVYTWGAGDKGQLGTNTTVPKGRHNPVRVEHRRMWVSLQSTSRNGKDRPIVSCGEYHSGICSVRGDVWMWGDNKYGQVYGLRPEDDSTIPEIVASPINAMFPASKASGPSLKRTSLLIKAKAQTIALLTGATSENADRNKTRVNRIPLLTLVPGEVIIKLVTGTRHTVVMTSHGAIWGWGDNTYGQNGDGNHHKHHHSHHHHHHHHHKKHPKKRRGISDNIENMLTTKAHRFHIGGRIHERNKTSHKKKHHHRHGHHHHHHQPEYTEQKQDIEPAETKKSSKSGISMPVLFSNVEASSTFTVAFSVAGEIWIWGHLDGVKGYHSGSGKQSIRLLSDLLPGHVQGGEIVCRKNTLLVNTKLGVFSIERSKMNDDDQNEQKHNIKPLSMSKPILVARRLSILDGQDVHSLKLAPGPRLYAILSQQMPAGMQVLRLKEGHTQDGSLEITHTAGDHLQFQVSLRTHPSVNATTRHGILRRANYLSLTTRVEPTKPNETGGANKSNEPIATDSTDSTDSTADSTDSPTTTETIETNNNWAPWDDIDVQVFGPFREQVQVSTTKPNVPYRVNGIPEEVNIDVTSKSAGAHWLNVTFQGAHVLGSPFSFHTLVGAPVYCTIKGHADSLGMGIMRIGVAHLIDVAMYDKFNNRCILGPTNTTGCVDMHQVQLFINGTHCSATCSAPTHPGATLSLLFHLDKKIFKPLPKVELTIVVGTNAIQGTLAVRSVHMVAPKDVVVSLPTQAIVGAPVEIKIGTTTANNVISNGGEKFVVTVIGPKARSGNKGGGFNNLPLNVRDHGNGSYMCVVWPHLPGIHLIAVQHVSYAIVNEDNGIQKQVKILQQVPGSPYRFQALLPQAGSAKRRRVVGSHINKLNAIFTRLDVDQDGTVPSSSLASEMKREGSVSRLLDGQSLGLMLGAGEITRDKFVESLVGSRVLLKPHKDEANASSDANDGGNVSDDDDENGDENDDNDDDNGNESYDDSYETEESEEEEHYDEEKCAWAQFAKEEAEEELKLERAARRIQAIQRGRQQRRVPLKKRKVVVNEKEIEQDSRVEGARQQQQQQQQIDNSHLLRRSRGRGIQMRIVDSSVMKNNSVNDVTSMLHQQQHQPHKEVVQRPPQRPFSARRRRHQRSRPSPRRPASASTKNRRGRPSLVTEGSAWGGLSLRKEVRQKLITLQRGPYGSSARSKTS